MGHSFLHDLVGIVGQMPLSALSGLLTAAALACFAKCGERLVGHAVTALGTRAPFP